MTARLHMRRNTRVSNRDAMARCAEPPRRRWRLASGSFTVACRAHTTTTGSGMDVGRDAPETKTSTDFHMYKGSATLPD